MYPLFIGTCPRTEEEKISICVLSTTSPWENLIPMTCLKKQTPCGLSKSFSTAKKTMMSHFALNHSLHKKRKENPTHGLYLIFAAFFIMYTLGIRASWSAKVKKIFFFCHAYFLFSSSLPLFWFLSRRVRLIFFLHGLLMFWTCDGNCVCSSVSCSGCKRTMHLMQLWKPACAK